MKHEWGEVWGIYWPSSYIRRTPMAEYVLMTDVGKYGTLDDPVEDEARRLLAEHFSKISGEEVDPTDLVIIIRPYEEAA